MRNEALESKATWRLTDTGAREASSAVSVSASRHVGFGVGHAQDAAEAPLRETAGELESKQYESTRSADARIAFFERRLCK